MRVQRLPEAWRACLPQPCSSVRCASLVGQPARPVRDGIPMLRATRMAPNPPRPWAPPPLQDVIVHHERAVHASYPNTSDAWRRAYILNFRKAECVAEERALGFTHSHNAPVQWDSYHRWGLACATCGGCLHRRRGWHVPQAGSLVTPWWGQLVHRISWGIRLLPFLVDCTAGFRAPRPGRLHQARAWP